MTPFFKNALGPVLGLIFTAMVAQTSAAQTSGDSLLADFNNDNHVNSEDLLHLLNEWHKAEPRFATSEQKLKGFRLARATWGDFDNDGDLDLAVGGLDEEGENPSFVIYTNQGGVLTEGQSHPYSTFRGIYQAGDFNNDGDLDLVFGSRFFVNQNEGYSEVAGINLPDRTAGALGDYDNDGDLDAVVSGRGSVAYLNESDAFIEDHEQSIASAFSDWVSFADLDNDGDRELLIASLAIETPIIEVYTKEDGVFVSSQTLGFGDRSVTGHGAWGDYDNDGDLDLVMSGTRGGIGPLGGTEIYQNNDGILTSKVVESINFVNGKPAWGDYDNDGDLDLALIGGTVVDAILYRNEGGQFIEATVETLEGVGGGSVTWADYDNDGDLDLALIGADASGERSANLYTNSEADSTGNANPNVAPSAPTTAFSAAYATDTLTLSWGAGSDTETPIAGLYFNLRVGTAPEANDVVSGIYGSPLLGNRGQAQIAILHIPERTYYWSVQTIDTGLAASPWSEEQVYEPGEL